MKSVIIRTMRQYSCLFLSSKTESIAAPGAQHCHRRHGHNPPTFIAMEAV
jgi:hypothetical protein